MQKRVTVRMGLRVVQRAAVPPSPALYNPGNASNVFYNTAEEKEISLQKKSPKPRKMVSDILTASNEQNTKKEKKVLKKEKSKTSLHQQNVTLHSCMDSPSLKLEQKIKTEILQGSTSKQTDDGTNLLNEKNSNFTENGSEGVKEINENTTPPKGL